MVERVQFKKATWAQQNFDTFLSWITDKRRMATDDEPLRAPKKRQPTVVVAGG